LCSEKSCQISFFNKPFLPEAVKSLQKEKMKKKNWLSLTALALVILIGMSSCYYGMYGPPRPHRPHGHHHGHGGGYGGGYGGGHGHR
jgi:hypothetical protein